MSWLERVDGTCCQSVEVKKVVLFHLGPSAVEMARALAPTPANARQGRTSENPALLAALLHHFFLLLAFGICSVSGFFNCNSRPISVSLSPATPDIPSL